MWSGCVTRACDPDMWHVSSKSKEVIQVTWTMHVVASCNHCVNVFATLWQKNDWVDVENAHQKIYVILESPHRRDIIVFIQYGKAGDEFSTSVEWYLSTAKQREIIRLVASVCPFVCLFVCLFTLSRLNRLTYMHGAEWSIYGLGLPSAREKHHDT